MNHASFYQNKVIWITGASSGIGENLAIQLARAGARLVLSSRKQPSLEALKATLENADAHLVLPLDLGNLGDTNLMIETILAQFGTIDILINNGGVSQRASAHDTSMETIPPRHRHCPT